MKTARRGFLQSLLATPFLPASVASSPAASPTPPAPDPVADAMVATVKARYGAQLDAAHLEAVRVEIEKSLEASARLKAMRLGNGDEPVTVFAARPKGEVLR